MADDRPFPPSGRRLALARRAGLHAASPLLVGAAATACAVLALGVLGRAIADRLGASVAAAISHAGDAAPAAAVDSVAGSVLELALPTLGVLGLAAIAIHFAQTRAFWLPRRRIDHAPSPPPARTRRAAWDMVGAVAIGVVAFAWLWSVAPRLAALPSIPIAAGALLLAALATFAIALVGLGVVDASLRHAELGRAIRMTAREKREDDRLAGADPRWRDLRRKLAREPRSADELAGATLLLLGDDVAVAIAWDPIRQPVPVKLAAGRGIRATQLLGLARRYRTPIHREPALAAILVDQPLAETHWPRLAEIVAAVKVGIGRDRP